METRNIIGFWELSEEWQAEAKSNLNDLREESFYLEPFEDQNPEEHILWDLSEVLRIEGEHEGFKYNAVMTISNNSAMYLNVDDGFETAKIKFV